jgi:hypothetical protein
MGPGKNRVLILENAHYSKTQSIQNEKYVVLFSSILLAGKGRLKGFWDFIPV